MTESRSSRLYGSLGFIGFGMAIASLVDSISMRRVLFFRTTAPDFTPFAVAGYLITFVSIGLILTGFIGLGRVEARELRVEDERTKRLAEAIKAGRMTMPASKDERTE